MSNDEYYPEWDENEADLELSNDPQFADEGVPWPRKGHPGSNYDGPKWGPHIANTGAFQRGLMSDKRMIECHYACAAEERAFAMLWDYYNNSRGHPILFSIIGVPSSFMNKGDQTITDLIKDDDDEKLVQLVAQSVIQWLGTNCGYHFINKAREIGQKDADRVRAAIKILGHRLGEKIELSSTDEIRIKGQIREEERLRKEEERLRKEEEKDRRIAEEREESMMRPRTLDI